MFDLSLSSKVKRTNFKPHPVPWPDEKTKLGGSNTIRRTVDEVRRILRPDS